MKKHNGHTPGPWRAITWACHAETTVVTDIDGEQVVVAECSGHGGYADDRVADARLIAAAPELWELVKDYLATAGDKTGPHKLADIDAKARKVLAKVTP